LAQAPAAPVQTPAAATSGTKVHGTITDPDGELIPGATITLTPTGSTKLSAVVQVQSGGDGTYSVTVPAGSYSLMVTMPGFASYSAAGVKIPAVASTTLDASLQVGTQTQVINVDANALQLSVDPDANASSTVITGKDLEALSDDPDELSSELTALAGPSAGPNGGQIYVDGFTGGQLPPKSSIREIRINQNPFSAQYDRLGYGRIEVFTKPGTDKIHGSLQVFGNTAGFNAASPLESGVYIPPYHTVFTQGSLTGPISKIASYSLGGYYRAIQDDAFTNAPIVVATAGSTTLCPAGAGCSVQSTLQVSTNTPQTRYQITPRLDLALGTKNVLTTRFAFEQNTQNNQGIGNLVLPQAGYTNSSAETELQMSDTQTFSAKLINETRFEYDRSNSTTTPLSTLPGVSVSGAFTGGGSSSQNSTDHQDHYEVQNYTSIQLKNNFVRLGGRLRATREAQDANPDTNGVFTYSSLGNYASASGAPSQFQFTQILVPKIDFTLADLGLYAEDEWKPKSNLTISYGLRYETQNHLNDHHDFAPRLSVSYGLFNGKGAPKTVLRGGFGIFYDRFGQGNVLSLLKENGTNERVFTVDSVPAGCSPNTFNPSNPGSCTAGTAANSQTVYSAASNLRTPYTIQDAIGADQQLGRYGTVSVNYIHSQGVHQLATQNIDFPDPYAPQPVTPLPNGAKNYQYFTEGVFNQNQLTVNGHVQTSKWFSLFGYYALNSAHGDTSGGGSFIATPYNMAADYGRTSFDVRQRIFLGGSVTLPKYIQLSPFMIGQSGNPYNVTTGSDNNGDSIFNDRPVFGAPNGTPAGQAGSNTIAGCGSFVQPPSSGTYKAVPVNYCTGPALFTLNLRLTKTFGFGPSTKPAQGDGQGGPGGGPPGGGGHGGGSRGGGGGGGPMFGGGGGTSTGKRYNLAVGLQVQNLFNNEDRAAPQASLSSPFFGQTTQLSGGPYTSDSAVRRITLQTSFNF
jgi:hypothetical protein